MAAKSASPAEVAGTDDQELQRIRRDVQMMSAHTVFDVDFVAQQCGQARLESDAPLFPPT